MSDFLVLLLASLLFVIAAIIVYSRQKRPGRIMQEGRLLKSEIVCRDGERFYVEKVGFKDWHVCIHYYYLISDRLAEGHHIVDQRWSYEDFCDVSISLVDYTYTLIRQVDVIAFVRSFRPIPIDEFDRIARPLIM
jgi:hypothetical protein